MTSLRHLAGPTVVVGTLLFVSGVSRAEDVIYIPAGFPSVCAQSLSKGRSYCPEGVSREATAFCSDSLPNLKRWISQKGLPLCGAHGNGTTGFDQVLLVDDRSLPAPLSRLLEPVAQDGRLFQKSGPFRDKDHVVRSVWIVGEGGGTGHSTGGNTGGDTNGTNHADRGSGPTGVEGDGNGTPGVVDGTPTNTDTGGNPHEDPGNATPGGNGGGTDVPSGGGPTERNPGTDETPDRPGGQASGGGDCQHGPLSYTEDRVTLTVVFDKDYLRFRSRVGQALSRYMVTSRANQFAVASTPLRQYHAKLMERANEMTKGQEVPVIALIKRRTCDRRVETVVFPDVQAVPATH